MIRLLVRPRQAPSLARVPPVGLVLVSVNAFQFGTAFSATLFSRIGPVGTSFVRMSFAALVLCLVVRPRLRGRARGEMGLLLAFGGALGAVNICLYEALGRIPLGIAMTIQFLGPLGVAAAASRRPRDFGWIALAGCGVVLLAERGAGGSLDGLGLALSLLAAASWATYIVLGQRVTHALPGAQGIAFAMVIAASVAALPGILSAGGRLLDAGSIGLGACAGALLAVPYALELEALRRMPRRVFGILMSLEPAAAALAGFIVLGQSLAAIEGAGIAMVIAASAGAAVTASDHAHARRAVAPRSLPCDTA